MVDIGLNPWTSEDERQHPRSIHEWWCLEAFLHTEAEGRQWSVRAYLWESHENPRQTESVFIITLLDVRTGKHATYTSRTSQGLTSKDDAFSVYYDDSGISGTFPQYSMFFHDKEHDIRLHLQYHAETIPHWVAQDVTDGWLPMGLGLFRYGFIPNGSISGTLTSNGESLQVNGHGYIEHVYGEYTYSHLGQRHIDIRKSISTYGHLIGWWLSNYKIRLPTSLMLATENNPMGNDWTWALLDNGWTIFYGNLLFWLMNGPAMGILILSKDGEHYTEFGNIHFRYTKTKYEATYGFLYPTELELNATQGNETLHLLCDMNPTRKEAFDVFSQDARYVNLVVCENPGVIQGYYQHDDETIPLSGVCKIELQRQITPLGHNSLNVQFRFPPSGFGVDLAFESHLLKKTLDAHIHFAPRPRMKFSIKPYENDAPADKGT